MRCNWSGGTALSKSVLLGGLGVLSDGHVRDSLGIEPTRAPEIIIAGENCLEFDRNPDPAATIVRTPISSKDLHVRFPNAYPDVPARWAGPYYKYTPNCSGSSRVIDGTSSSWSVINASSDREVCGICLPRRRAMFRWAVSMIPRSVRALA